MDTHVVFSSQPLKPEAHKLSPTLKESILDIEWTVKNCFSTKKDGYQELINALPELRNMQENGVSYNIHWTERSVHC